MKIIVALSLITIFGNASLFAQTSSTAGAGTTGASTPDSQFAKKAAQGGMAEVKMGQLAQEKGTNPVVKNFGKMMEDDHAKANAKLKVIASQENITLPRRLSKQDQATYDTLSKLSGHEFDEAYAHDMVEDHKKDIADFKKESLGGQDADIKGFAAETLPTLQNHLTHADEMARAVTP